MRMYVNILMLQVNDTEYHSEGCYYFTAWQILNLYTCSVGCSTWNLPRFLTEIQTSYVSVQVEISLVQYSIDPFPGS